jgi:hypothetical protein
VAQQKLAGGGPEEADAADGCGGGILIVSTGTSLVSVILPLVGVAIGAIAALYGSYLQHTWAWKRDQQGRIESRSAELAAARSRFQHQTLVELQDALMQLARATGKAHVQDLMNFQQSGIWQRELIDDETSEKHGNYTRQVIVLVSRVENDEVRRIALEVKSDLHSALSSESVDASQNFMANMDSKLNELNRVVGIQLQQLHS